MTDEQNEALILVADDDPAILRLVTAIVEREGHQVFAARDGKEAYNMLLSGRKFGAVILDVMMPHVQGTELIKFMQSEEHLMDVPIIMMTAEQNPALSSESLSAGAVAFLPKPFTAVQLKTMLQTFAQQL